MVKLYEYSDAQGHFEAAFDEKASANPLHWSIFLSNDGEYVDFNCEKVIDTCAAKFDVIECDFSKLAFNELLVLLMDGSNEQCLKARREIRVRFFDCEEVKNNRYQEWKYYSRSQCEE